MMEFLFEHMRNLIQNETMENEKEEKSDYEKHIYMLIIIIIILGSFIVVFTIVYLILKWRKKKKDEEDMLKKINEIGKIEKIEMNDLDSNKKYTRKKTKTRTVNYKLRPNFFSNIRSKTFFESCNNHNLDEDEKDEKDHEYDNYTFCTISPSKDNKEFE